MKDFLQTRGWWGGHKVFEGMNPLHPSLPCKAIKLFLSLSSKTLSCSMLVHSGQVLTRAASWESQPVANKSNHCGKTKTISDNRAKGPNDGVRIHGKQPTKKPHPNKVSNFALGRDFYGAELSPNQKTFPGPREKIWEHLTCGISELHESVACYLPLALSSFKWKSQL